MRRSSIHSSLAEHQRGQEQQGVDIIELKLVSHGKETLFNQLLCTDWTSCSLSLVLLKRTPSLVLPTIKSLIGALILALRTTRF